MSKLRGRPRGNGMGDWRAIAVYIDQLVLNCKWRLWVVWANKAALQYDFGNPKAFSAMKLRMSCGEIGAMRVINASRRYRSTWNSLA